jgi:fatty acid desaturase
MYKTMNYLNYKPAIDKEVLASLSKRHSFRSALYIANVFVIIFGVLAIATLYPLWPVLVLAFIVMGVLHHQLLIIQHEALHFFLFKHRSTNNLIGHLVSFMIGFTMAYRKHHFRHHRALASEMDPDNHNYSKRIYSRSEIVRTIFINLSGISSVIQFFSQSQVETGVRDDAKKFDKGLIGVVLTQGVLLALFTLFSEWYFYFLLWLFPLVTIAKAITNFRNMAEHLLRPANSTLEVEDTRLRSIRCGLVEKLIFAPMNFNFHAEHHLFLSVPYQSLPALNKLCMNIPNYQKYVDIQEGYISTILRYSK